MTISRSKGGKPEIKTPPVSVRPEGMGAGSGRMGKPQEFRGVQVAIGQDGKYSVQGTPGVTVFEIFGVLTLLMNKMEKDLNS